MALTECSRLNCVLPKDRFQPIFVVNVTLFGNRVFANFLKRKSYGSRMGPKSNDWCPAKKERRHIDTQGRRLQRQRLECYAASQGTPLDAGKRRGRGPFPRALRGSVALPNVDFTFRFLLQILERIRLYCWKPLRLWWLSVAALENKHTGYIPDWTFRCLYFISCPHRSRS